MSHSEFSRVEDGDDALAAAIRARRWRELEHLTLRQRALCELAEKLSATPTQMTRADWQPLRDLGFDDHGCLEVAHVVGLFNYFTRLADGFGLQVAPELLAAAGGGSALRRPDHGEHPCADRSTQRASGIAASGSTSRRQ